MRMLMLVVVVSGCATTTPREKIVSGTTRIAFGAPLVLAGASNVAAAGAVVVASQVEPRLFPVSYAIPPAVGAVVWLSVGAFLLYNGSETLTEGLTPQISREERMESHREREKAQRLDDLEPASPDCRPGWDC